MKNRSRGILALIILIPALTGLLLACTAPTPAPTPTTTPAQTTSPGPAPQEQVVEVQARSYTFNPANIQVPVNTPVRFIVTSEDIDHTFTVKESKEAQEILVNIEIGGGQTAEGTYTFQETGSYYLYCIPHEQLGMVGTIEVTG